MNFSLTRERRFPTVNEATVSAFAALLEARKMSRFNKLKSSLAHRKHAPSDPAAVAAVIGRRKYGNAGMARLAARGKAKG
jgi:hypothetical protein